MKATVDRATLLGMLSHLGGRMPGTDRADSRLRLSACQARVFVEANGVTAGVEALVTEDGGCILPRVTFEKILRTFRRKKCVTLDADVNRIRIGNFEMSVLSYTPTPSPPPGEFEVFPVTDAWLARPCRPGTTRPGER